MQSFTNRLTGIVSAKQPDEPDEPDAFQQRQGFPGELLATGTSSPKGIFDISTATAPFYVQSRKYPRRKSFFRLS